MLGVLQSHSRSKDNEGMHGNGSLGNIREIEDIEGVIDFGLSMLERLAFSTIQAKNVHLRYPNASQMERQ